MVRFFIFFNKLAIFTKLKIGASNFFFKPCGGDCEKAIILPGGALDFSDVNKG